MPLSRSTSMLVAGLLYACGIVVISLTPLQDWVFIPEPPWGFLFLPWPRYWTGFDVLVNVLAYIPLGLLLGRGLSLKLRSAQQRALKAVLFSLLLGVLLSLVMEGLQTYLPSRRPQLLDVLANGSGTLIGGFFAGAYGRNRISFHFNETRPIEIGGAMLLAVWLLAQAAPQQIWLALGDIGLQVDWSRQIPSEVDSFAAQRTLAEALCVASAMLSCALICHLTLLESSRWFPSYQPRHWAITLITVVVLTLGIRAWWIWALSTPGALEAWFNAGAQAGLVLAILSGYGLAGARPTQQRIVAIAGLAVTLMLANSLPENGYAAETFAAWSRGRWFNLQALANLAAALWPFAAMTWLVFVLTRKSARSLDRRLGKPGMPGLSR
ncbi:VanZ family protein [beta proteobacterium MWH-UniP1]